LLTILCVAIGVILAVAPFVIEYRAVSRFAEASVLKEVVSQIKNFDELSGQIKSATMQWQNAEQSVEKTAEIARTIAECMAVEAKVVSDSMDRASDREKSILRLEVEKLRRAEAEWLQVLVRMLDHVYALHVGALRSHQPTVIEQVGHFQDACRDVARRVGLTPFIAVNAEPFDGRRHQLVDGDSKVAEGATIGETIAAGYTFQGKLLRPALVKIANGDRPHLSPSI
jgi:molecular chaperone GrpE (heat shock protein)